jgi:hypothetical protein
MKRNNDMERYGSIVSGEIDIATAVYYDPERGVYHPTDKEYRAMGFKRLINYYDVSAEDYVYDGMVH